MNYKGTVSLVTGGAGFVGSYICEYLLSKGQKVICIDNLVTGAKSNVSHLLSNPDFRMISHDIIHPAYLDEIYNEKIQSVDFVYHFASPASPKDYYNHPIHTLKVGSMGTLNSLGIAKRYGSTFILASSSEVYGDPEVNPQHESYQGRVSTTGPRSVYDEAKRFAEALASAYYHAHGVKVKIARLFNTYGPRMRIDDGRAVPNFMSQALKGDPITVYGDGSQTRSLCYVSDTVEAICRLAEYVSSPNDNKGIEEITGPIVMNIGNPVEMTVLDIAESIKEIAKSKSQIIFEPLPIHDPKVRRPDIGLANRLLGWQPKVDYEIGIRNTLNYFRDATKNNKR
tara:strand:- start:26 stop:1045 length:1020 start_codon:yes stop_codon:yes gene_type:complete